MNTSNEHDGNSDETTYSEIYFDALYDDSTDPWQYQTRWYEKRKRDICLSILPQPHYHRAIELGCGNGVFSQLLALRCDSLLSIDGNQKAVLLARDRLQNTPHVRVLQGIIPDVLYSLNARDVTETQPINREISRSAKATTETEGYDLIVISEILYYLSPTDIEAVIAWVAKNLSTSGTLLCCHWRYEIEGFQMNGELVHERLHQTLNIDNKIAGIKTTLTHQSQFIDSDFLLDVWQNSSHTIAMQENLV